MTQEAISPLRRRMIEDMTVRNFASDTQRNYIRAVKNLTVFLGRSPDTAMAEDLRRFQLHLTDTGVRPPTINGTVSALRFFFSVTAFSRRHRGRSTRLRSVRPTGRACASPRSCR